MLLVPQIMNYFVYAECTFMANRYFAQSIEEHWWGSHPQGSTAFVDGKIRVNHPHPRRTTLANLLIIFAQCKLVCYIDVNDYEVWISKWQLQENEFWGYFFKYNDLVYASNIPLK